MKEKAGLGAEWIDVTEPTIEHYKRPKDILEKQIAAIDEKIAEAARGGDDGAVGCSVHGVLLISERVRCPCCGSQKISVLFVMSSMPTRRTAGR